MRHEGWRGADPPTTPLQRNAFLDTCTAWLTSEPTSGDASSIDQFDDCTAVVVHPLQSRRTGFAFTHSDELRDECAICGGGNATIPIIANPFTQCCRISMCNVCFCTKHEESGVPNTCLR